MHNILDQAPKSSADVMLERVVLASVVQNDGQEITPNIRRVLDFHASFQEPSLSAIAEAIKRASTNGHFPNTFEIGKHLDAKHTGDLTLLAMDTMNSLPIGLAEVEAETLLARFKSERVISTLGEAWESARANPKETEVIAAHACAALESLAADGDGKSMRLTLRSPDELLAMQFDDSDRILGDRLLSSGQSLVIAGAGGIGKSRILLQLAVACRAGLPFISFETRGQELRWLIIQAENSNRRLKNDLAALRAWVGEKHWPQANEGILIHTLETDVDGFLSLDSEQAQARIRAAVARFKPDVVCFDSLYNFGAGDLNSDRDMAETLLTISRLSKAGNPNRACVVLHHALTGRSGAGRAVGYDRSSFGRNSKVLHSWCRAMVNIAPGSPDSNEVLVVTCGKMSNGQEFSRFAVRLNPETMIYSVDEAFDLSAWQADVTGKRMENDLSPARVAEIVTELCKVGGAPKKPAIVKALRDETGCATSGAYKAIERAERAKKIHYTKATKTYVTS